MYLVLQLQDGDFEKGRDLGQQLDVKVCHVHDACHSWDETGTALSNPVILILKNQKNQVDTVCYVAMCLWCPAIKIPQNDGLFSLKLNFAQNQNYRCEKFFCNVHLCSQRIMLLLVMCSKQTRADIHKLSLPHEHWLHFSLCENSYKFTLCK